MKKIYVLSLVLLMAGWVSCSKEEQGNQQGTQGSESAVLQPKKVGVNSNLKYQLVAESEYKNASAFEKSFYDKLNTSALALLSLEDESYEAIISVSKPNKQDDNFSDMILIFKKGETEESSETDAKNSCKICDFRSGYSCLKEIKNTDKEEFDIHVKREGECFVLTW